MKTLQLLNEKGLDALKLLSIAVNHEPEIGVYSLMYDQINSPTGDPIVQECRGLIVKEADGKWHLVSRGFDRFFNYGERETTAYKDMQLVFLPKLDGSLIKVYFHNGKYHIASKARAVAGTLTGFRDKTKRFHMRDLVFKSLGISSDEEFQTLMTRANPYETDLTFIFELTTPDNQVVTPYEEYALTLLAVRHNQTAEYLFTDNWAFLFKVAEGVFTGTPAQAVEKARELRGFQEGFVGYHYGQPVVKIKSPQYVAAHHLRTDFSVEKNALRILILREHEEFLAYFPDLAKMFAELDTRLNTWISELSAIYREAESTLPPEADDKTARKHLAQYFAKVKGNNILFGAYKEKTDPESFYWKIMKEDDRFRVTYDTLVARGDIIIQNP